MEVSVIGAGTQDNIELQVDPTRQGARVILQPLEWAPAGGSVGGHYRIDQISGAVAGAVAANAELWNFRWADNGKYAVIKFVNISAVYTAISTPLFIDFELIKATNWTTNGSGGSSTNITNPTKLFSRMNASSFTSYGDLRVAGTAAITAGTKNLDSQGMGYIAPQLSATPVANITTLNGDLFKDDKMAGHPIILAPNEGLVIRTPKGWAASNTTQLTVNCEWAEVNAW